jgi:hypothetical protein
MNKVRKRFFVVLQTRAPSARRRVADAHLRHDVVSQTRAFGTKKNQKTFPLGARTYAARRRNRPTISP